MLGRSGWAAALSCLVAGGALAQGTSTEVSTAQLARICTIEPAFCDGYITGAGQLYAVFLAADRVEKLACAEPSPTLEEIRATFVAWAAANPAKGSEKAIDGLAQAAAAKWPCRS